MEILIAWCGGWVLGHGIRHKEEDIIIIGVILIGLAMYLGVK